MRLHAPPDVLAMGGEWDEYRLGGASGCVGGWGGPAGSGTETRMGFCMHMPARMYQPLTTAGFKSAHPPTALASTPASPSPHSSSLLSNTLLPYSHYALHTATHSQCQTLNYGHSLRPVTYFAATMHYIRTATHSQVCWSPRPPTPGPSSSSNSRPRTERWARQGSRMRPGGQGAIM